MRKFLFLSIAAFFVSFWGNAQFNLDYGMRFGLANYLGDIGGQLGPSKAGLADLNLGQTKYAVCGFARYKINPMFGAQAALSYLRISGADKYSKEPGRVARNLSFRTDIVELATYGQFYFFEIQDIGKTYKYNNDFRAYVYAGLSTFYFRPTAKLDGQWYGLRKLKTEGQPKPYSPISFSVPMGMGFYFTSQKKYRIGLEFSWRKTFTDYLDDISTVYPDQADLPNETAIKLSNRRNELTDPELPHPNNYIAENRRGNPENKDAYLFTTINGSYVLRGKSSFYRSRYGSAFKGTRHKRRRVRAKF